MEILGLMREAFPQKHLSRITAHSEKIKVLVIGTPRSGTGYSAKVFNTAHYPFGHEDIYGLGHVIKKHHPELLMGESSWLAVPFVEFVKFASPDVKIIHVIRDPLLTFQSLIKTGYSRGVGNSQRYLNFATTIDQKNRDMTKFIINWNIEAAKHADYTYYLYEDPRKMLDFCGIGVNKKIDYKLNKIGNKVNGSNRKYVQGMMPPSKEILELSKMYNNKELLYKE